MPAFAYGWHLCPPSSCLPTCVLVMLVGSKQHPLHADVDCLSFAAHCVPVAAKSFNGPVQELPALSEALTLLNEHRGALAMKESISMAVSALKSDSRAVRANALQVGHCTCDCIMSLCRCWTHIAAAAAASVVCRPLVLQFSAALAKIAQALVQQASMRDDAHVAHASCVWQDLRNSMHSYRSWLAEQWQLLSANEGALLRQARPDWPNSLLCIMTSLLRCCDPEVQRRHATACALCWDSNKSHHHELVTFHIGPKNCKA